MRLLSKYAPQALSEFVGGAARAEGQQLLTRRPLRALIIEDYGCGKTTMAYLLTKGHFCAQTGACGACPGCQLVASQWPLWGGRQFLRGQEEKDEQPWFLRFDCTNTTAEQVKGLRKLIPAGASRQPDPFFKDYPEVVVIDEAHRADAKAQELLLTPLEGKAAASVILCVARDNLGRVIKPLRQRLMPFELGRPEVGELVVWAQGIADKEGIEVVSTEAMEDLIDLCDLVPRNVLVALEMVMAQGGQLSSSIAHKVGGRIRRSQA